jgi:O-acetylserine/cysteine efflux transporter
VKYIDTGIGAVLGQLQVPFSAVLAALVFKDPFGWRRWAGIGLALAGTAVLVGAPTRDSELDAVAMIVAASLISAFGFVQGKRLAHLDALTLTGWGALFAAPVLALGSLWLEGGQIAAIRGAPAHLWLALAYNVLLVSIAGYTTWYFFLSRYPVTKVVPLTLLIPVFALIGGVAFYGETLTAPKIAGAALVLLGVAVILFRRPGTAAAPVAR